MGSSPTRHSYSCRREPQGFSQKVYSEKVIGHCTDLENTDCFDWSGRVRYLNFRISNDSLIEIKQLSDLFLPNSNWEPKLDSLITEAIQKDQVFGLSCTDLPGTVEKLKRHFFLVREGLAFHLCDYDGKDLSVPLAEMKDYLRWSDLFE